MPSHIRRIILNQDERVTHTDHMNQRALTDRALLIGMASVLDDTGRTGVVRGLNVSLTGTDQNCTVNPGIALIGSTAGTYDAEFEWIELGSTSTVDLSTYVDGANPRWVCIEIAENSSTSQDTAFVYDPTILTESATSVDKITQSDPTINVRAGTAAASPVMPSGAAGYIPLAYILLPASGNIPATNIVHCRPRLRTNSGALSSPTTSATWSYGEAHGGGVDVAASPSDNIVVQPCHGHFPQSGVPFSIDQPVTIDTSLTNAWDYGIVPSATRSTAYVYACKVPYPAGYDAILADREFEPGAGVLSNFACVGAGVHGCVILVAETAPDPDTGTMGHYSGGFGAGCYDTPFGYAAGNINANETVYLGQFGYYDLGGYPLNQTYVGNGIVRIEDHPFDSTLATGTATYDCVGGNGLATTQIDPNIAIEYDILVGLDIDSPNVIATIYIDTFEYPANYRHTLYLPLASNLYCTRMSITDATPTVTIALSGGTINSGYLRTVGYTDRILARR